MKHTKVYRMMSSGLLIMLVTSMLVAMLAYTVPMPALAAARVCSDSIV